MSTLTIALISGGAVMLAMFVLQARAKKQALEVLPILQAKGPLTIPAIMLELDIKGMQAQGNVVFALNALISQGAIVEDPVPPGTPQLQKIKVRTYRVK